MKNTRVWFLSGILFCVVMVWVVLPAPSHAIPYYYPCDDAFINDFYCTDGTRVEGVSVNGTGNEVLLSTVSRVSPLYQSYCSIPVYDNASDASLTYTYLDFSDMEFTAVFYVRVNNPGGYQTLLYPLDASEKNNFL